MTVPRYRNILFEVFGFVCYLCHKFKVLHTQYILYIFISRFLFSIAVKRSSRYLTQKDVEASRTCYPHSKKWSCFFFFFNVRQIFIQSNCRKIPFCGIIGANCWSPHFCAKGNLAQKDGISSFLASVDKERYLLAMRLEGKWDSSEGKHIRLFSVGCKKNLMCVT